MSPDHQTPVSACISAVILDGNVLSHLEHLGVNEPVAIPRKIGHPCVQGEIAPNHDDATSTSAFQTQHARLHRRHRAVRAAAEGARRWPPIDSVRRSRS